MCPTHFSRKKRRNFWKYLVLIIDNASLNLLRWVQIFVFFKFSEIFFTFFKIMSGYYWKCMWSQISTFCLFLSLTISEVSAIFYFCGHVTLKSAKNNNLKVIKMATIWSVFNRFLPKSNQHQFKVYWLFYKILNRFMPPFVHNFLIACRFQDSWSLPPPEPFLTKSIYASRWDCVINRLFNQQLYRYLYNNEHHYKHIHKHHGHQSLLTSQMNYLFATKYSHFIQ